MAKRPKWKIGDRVRLLEPKEFVRCGYPMHLPEVTDDVYENHTDKLHAALIAFGLKKTNNHRVMRKLAGAMAFAKIQHDGFGSPRRQIFEEEIDLWRVDQEYEIINRYHVMTGEYYGPSGGGDWYEPGGLADQKHNTILVLNSYGKLGLVYPRRVSIEQIVARRGSKYHKDGYLHVWDKRVTRAEPEPTISPSSS